MTRRVKVSDLSGISTAAFGGKKIHSFHIHNEGAVEKELLVYGLNLGTDKPSCIVIQPCTPNRVAAGYPDKLVTFVTKTDKNSITFKYRRVDNSTADPAATFRFDFLVIE